MRRITLKQRKFVKHYIENNGNASKAVLQAGYNTTSKNMPKVIAYRNFKSKTVQNYMSKVLERNGLSENRIAKTLRTAVEAGTSPKALREASLKDALKATDMVIRIQGNYAPTRLESKNANLNIDLTGKAPKDLEEMLLDLQTEIKSFIKMKNRTDKINRERKPQENIRSFEDINY